MAGTECLLVFVVTRAKRRVAFAGFTHVHNMHTL